MFDFQVRFDSCSLFFQVTDYVAVHPNMGIPCALQWKDHFQQAGKRDNPAHFPINVPLLSLLGLPDSSYSSKQFVTYTFLKIYFK